MAFQTQRRERPDPASLDLADGTVTRVAQQAKDPDRASVFIDDAFAFGLAIDLVIEAGLKKGVVLTAGRQRELLTRQETFAARSAALSSIAHRARTTGEISRMLTTKGFESALVEDTVASLVASGLLDDAAYARAYAQARFQGPGHGPARIRQDLQRRGVARDVIDVALADLEDAEDLGARARRDAEKRWLSLASETDVRKRKKKTLDFLVRRGFSFDDARQAVDAAEAEHPPGDEGAADWDD